MIHGTSFKKIVAELVKQNNPMKENAKPGDIFTQKLDNGNYMFGRVLMDIGSQCFDSKIITKKSDSLLRLYTPGYVIEVFDTISDNDSMPEKYQITIPGIAVDADAFENDEWKVIGFEAVNYKDIDFQESLNFYDGELDFQRGEVFISVNVPDKMINEEIESFQTAALVNSYLILEDTFNYLETNDATELLDYDMRLLPAFTRNLVYQIIGEDPESSYYNLALKHGFDTARFFNSKNTETTKAEANADQKQILEGVNWSFVGQPFEHFNEFETCLIKDRIQLSNEVVLIHSKIKIVCELVDEKDLDQKIECVIIADNNQSFSAKELLFKIHNEMVAELANNDYHFFEGLTLLTENDKLPVYMLNLGN